MRKAPTTYNPSRTDGPAWVGKALISALKKSPELSEPLVRLVQDKAGPGSALDLINALQEVDISVGAVAVKKRQELSEADKEKRRESLKKARAAKKAKSEPKEE